MTEIFKVPEVSCGHCKAAIEGAVAPLEGVQSALVDIEAKTVQVDYDAAKIGIFVASAVAGLLGVFLLWRPARLDAQTRGATHETGTPLELTSSIMDGSHAGPG